jgi:hypothetical protein
MVVGVIYLATNIKNGMMYVGQTSNFDARFAAYKNVLNIRTGRLTPFEKAFSEAESDFVWEMLEECNSREELNNKEIELIKHYNTKRPNGYNVLRGGYYQKLYYVSLTEEKIIGFVKSFYKVHGRYPAAHTKENDGLPEGYTWITIDSALTHCSQGITAKSSIAKLISKHLGVRYKGDLPDFSEEKIVEWAKKYFLVHNKYPSIRTKPSDWLPEGETWIALDIALKRGTRGLPGGSSVAKLFEKYFGIRNKTNIPKISEQCIIDYMIVFKDKYGYFPHAHSKENEMLPSGESWHGFDKALRNARRGLTKTTLASLKEKYFGIKNILTLTKLFEKQITKWVIEHYNKYGEYPSKKTEINSLPNGECWRKLEADLAQGHRGLPGNNSLAKIKRKLKAKRK